MKSKLNIMTSTKIFVIAFAIVSCGFGLRAEEAKPDAASSPSNQKQFNTPKEAAEALVKAADTFDVAALKEILGPDAEDIVSSEDQVQDKNRAAAFAAKGKEKISVGSDKDPKIAIVTVGKDNFPLPIPLVRNKAKWSFDTKVGREEILNRRIGGNELDAIGICRGFVEAQQEYALQKHASWITLDVCLLARGRVKPGSIFFQCRERSGPFDEGLQRIVFQSDHTQHCRLWRHFTRVETGSHACGDGSDDRCALHGGIDCTPGFDSWRAEVR